MLERKPPTWTSILSSSSIFSVLRRPTSGLDSSSATTISTGRPLMPPALVDAVDRHLQTDQRGLAAGRAGARQRLQRADLVGLGLAEGRLPRRRHQHGRAERARRCAIADHAAARDLAAIPEAVMVASVVSHDESLSDPLGQTPGSSPRADRRRPGSSPPPSSGGGNHRADSGRGGRRKNPSDVPPKDFGTPCPSSDVFIQTCPIIHKGHGVPTAGRCKSPAWCGFCALPRQWADCAGR